MPHVIVKLHSGRSEQQKSKLGELITQAVMTGARCAQQSVSVVIEDVETAEWTEKVYEPDIMGQADKLYKKPGYKPALTTEHRRFPDPCMSCRKSREQQDFVWTNDQIRHAQ